MVTWMADRSARGAAAMHYDAQQPAAGH